MMRYVEPVPWEMATWTVKAGSAWTRDRFSTEQEIEDFGGYFSSQGYEKVSENDGLAVFAHPKVDRKFRYVIVVKIGPVTEVINAPDLPDLLYALRYLSSFDLRN
ncbi:MAG: hypothetical protein QOI31_1751 [Solirubrobacterales bacterium]|jgi:hypothetical protein|nr:hypothetical protein [Solirubrobacterales bacterium]